MRIGSPASLWPTYLSESAERRMTELRLPNGIHDTLEYGNHCMHLEPGQCIWNAKWCDPDKQETKYKVAACVIRKVEDGEVRGGREEEKREGDRGGRETIKQLKCSRKQQEAIRGSNCNPRFPQDIGNQKLD